LSDVGLSRVMVVILRNRFTLSISVCEEVYLLGAENIRKPHDLNRKVFCQIDNITAINVINADTS